MQMWRNKRTLSESDCEDIYNDDISKDCSSPGEGASESCASGGGNMTRKRRRGIIEKRRRDRINHSLLELRRLVPSAFEKQGSAKLEKAEILQLTVDHLKMIHAKGLDSMAYDPQRYAMDYHSMGFRECAGEVARYLVTVEGMDVQDPLRMRLMTHLQCFATQRELSSKQVVPVAPVAAVAAAVAASAGPASSGWPFPATQGSYNGSNAPGHYNNGGGSHHQNVSNAAPMFDQSHLNYAMADNSGYHPHGPNTSGSSGARLVTSTSSQSIMPTMTTLQPVAPGSGGPHSTAYPHVNHHPFASLAAQNSGYSTAGNSVKPYRPWGAELAY